MTQCDLCVLETCSLNCAKGLNKINGGYHANLHWRSYCFPTSWQNSQFNRSQVVEIKATKTKRKINQAITATVIGGWPFYVNWECIIYISLVWQVFGELQLDAEWSINAGSWLSLSGSNFGQHTLPFLCPGDLAKKIDPTGEYIRYIMWTLLSKIVTRLLLKIQLYSDTIDVNWVLGSYL